MTRRPSFRTSNAPRGRATPLPRQRPVTAQHRDCAPPPQCATAHQTATSNAAYLQNPGAHLPHPSKRMGEQGKVVLRAHWDRWAAPKIELNRSSGFERLDRQAQETVSRWKFVPGKRNGVPEAMWYLVPINFVLE